MVSYSNILLWHVMSIIECNLPKTMHYRKIMSLQWHNDTENFIQVSIIRGITIGEKNGFNSEYKERDYQKNKLLEEEELKQFWGPAVRTGG
jgi:hypothetical protein